MTSEIKFISSQKGKRKLIYKNYVFQKDNQRGNNSYWACDKKGSKNCMAWIVLINNEFSTENLKEHNHLPDQLKIQTEEFKIKLKRTVQENPVNSLKNIYDSVFSNEVKRLKQNNYSDLEIGTILKPFKSVQTILNYEKHKYIPNQPENRRDISINGDYMLTKKNESFLLIDTNDEERIFVFCINNFFKIMCDTDTIFMDGTFNTVPKIYTQLYTLHGFFKDQMIPFIYILLPDKKLTTYLRIFRLLQDKALELGLVFAPKTFQIDFETAVIRAINTIYPSSNIKGCLFHFSQAILRNISIKGLTEYRNNDNLHKLVRRTSALPFLPIEKIWYVWDEIMELSDRTDEKVVKFLDYVTDTWIYQPLFEPTIWNHYRNYSTRTNNHLEGWHNSLNKKAGGSHKNFFEFINLLKDQ